MPFRLESLLEPRWRPLVYGPAAVALTIMVLAAVGVVGAFFAAFFMFAFPYWMGERRPKVLAVAGALMILVSGLGLAGVLTWGSYQDYEPVQQSVGGVLTAGTVDPVFGGPDTTFTFQVVYTPDQAPAEGPRVLITSAFFATTATRNESMVPDVSTDTPYGDGIRYVFSTRLPSDGRHHFRFVVQLDDGSWVATVDASGATQNSRGPVNMPALLFFGLLVASWVPILYIMVGILLALGVLAYWWWGEAKQKRKRFVGSRSCPSCGKEWPWDEETCPHCGLRV